MGNLWLRITVRRSRRATWTIIGLALCTMYLSGTIALVGGLHKTTASIASTFKQGPIVVFQGSTLSDSKIPISTAHSLSKGTATICLVDINLSVLGGPPMRAYAASIHDEGDILGFDMGNLTTEDTMVSREVNSRFVNLGTPIYLSARLNISSPQASHICHVVAIFGSGTLIPQDWVIVNDEIIRSLDRGFAGNCSMIVLPEGDSTDQSTMASLGYHTQNSMAVINFFELGTYQIEGALWGLILITGVIVCLLVYNTISIEVSMRKGDILLLKKIGAEPERIGSLFVARGVYLAACGGAIGVCAGYLAANLLVSIAALRGLTTLIVPQASIESLLLPLGVVLLASLVGASLPSFLAGREQMGGST